MDLLHDLRGRGLVFAKKLLQDHNHKLHGRVVVIEHDHLIHGRRLHARGRTLQHHPAAFVMLGAGRRIRGTGGGKRSHEKSFYRRRGRTRPASNDRKTTPCKPGQKFSEKTRNTPYSHLTLKKSIPKWDRKRQQPHQKKELSRI